MNFLEIGMSSAASESMDRAEDRSLSEEDARGLFGSGSEDERSM